MLGVSATKRREAAVAEFAGATYIGAGPIWETPSKPDAAPPIGLDGLRDICLSVSIPVVAIGGIDASNAPPSASGREPQALPSFAPWPRSKPSGRPSMKLS